jgi:hypothetical protein
MVFVSGYEFPVLPVTVHEPTLVGAEAVPYWQSTAVLYTVPADEPDDCATAVHALLAGVKPLGPEYAQLV